MAEFSSISASQASDIASMLGLANPASYDDLKLAGRVAKGVPPTSAKRLTKIVDPDGLHLKKRALVPRRSAQRQAQLKKPLSAEKSQTLWLVARVLREAFRQYGSMSEARDFMFRPHPLLESRAPMDLTLEGAAGAAIVIETLENAEAGVAV